MAWKHEEKQMLANRNKPATNHISTLRK